MGAHFLSPSDPSSEPLTDPGMSEEEARVILRESVRSDQQELTREHFAAIKKLSDNALSKLAVVGLLLDGGEKKELFKGALH